MSAYALVAPLPILFLDNGLRKAEGDNPSAWAPVNYMGDPKESYGSWPCLVLQHPLQVLGEGNSGLIDLSVSLSLHLFLSQRKILIAWFQILVLIPILALFM